MLFAIIVALSFTPSLCLNRTNGTAEDGVVNVTNIHVNGNANITSSGGTVVEKGTIYVYYDTVSIFLTFLNLRLSVSVMTFIQFINRTINQIREKEPCGHYCAITVALVTFLFTCFSFCASVYLSVVVFMDPKTDHNHQQQLPLYQGQQAALQPLQQHEPEKKSKVQSIKSKVEKAALEVSRRSRKSKKSEKETSEKKTAIADGSEKKTAIADGSQKQSVPVDASEKKTGATVEGFEKMPGVPAGVVEAQQDASHRNAEPTPDTPMEAVKTSGSVVKNQFRSINLSIFKYKFE